MMKRPNIQITAATCWLLTVFTFVGLGSANAQDVTWIRNLEVNQQVSDRGQYVSLLDMADSGIAGISNVRVDLSLSSLSQQNPMWLGQVYASLTYGVASEEERTAVLLNRPGVSNSNSFGSSLSSLNVTFDDSAATNIFNVASGTGTYQADGRLGVNPLGNRVAYNSGDINSGLAALNGNGLLSQKFSLLVADTQQGARANLDRWGVKVTGTAASSGLLNLGDGGSVAATGTGTQTVGGTVQSSGEVGLQAAANQILNLSGGLSGYGVFKKTGAGTVNVGNSSGFTGNLNVDGGKVVVDGVLGADSTVNVRTGSSLGGSGSVGLLYLERGATLTPGNSPGLLTAGTAIWSAGATYEWELGNLTGVAGTDWDLLQVNGLLNFLSGSGVSDKFNLTLLSNGNFDLSSGYEWTFVQAANIDGLGSLALGSDITNFFNITTQGMDVGTEPANVRVLVGATENGLTSLNVWAVPEPSTGSLMMLGLSGLVLTRLLRRKVS
jgi:autotransporter-associated beta strand protein